MKTNQVRETLLASATSLIDEGVNWTWSLREIADDAGVGSNEIFRRFKSREAFVQELCGRWGEDLQEILREHEGISRHLENLRWLVKHRKRFIFLLAESIQSKGTPEVTKEMEALLPNLECIVRELRALDCGAFPAGTTDDDLTRRVAEATQAGVGLLLFAPSPFSSEAPDEGDLLRGIWQKLWQISTGLDGTSAPAYF